MLNFLERQRKKQSREEGLLQSDVLKWLERRGILAWRVPVGPVIHRHNKNGKLVTAWKKNPLKGFPDVSGVLSRKRRGVLFVIELKSKRGRTTPEQADWMSSLEAAGAACAVVRSLVELEKTMREWGEIT